MVGRGKREGVTYRGLKHCEWPCCTVVLYVVVTVGAVFGLQVFAQQLGKPVGLGLGQAEVLFDYTPSVTHVVGHEVFKGIGRHHVVGFAFYKTVYEVGRVEVEYPVIYGEVVVATLYAQCGVTFKLVDLIAGEAGYQAHTDRVVGQHLVTGL